MHQRLRVALCAFLTLTLILPRLDASEGESNRPRLVVLMVFDQLRGDYPERWHAQFGEGGFKRLGKEGTWFKNCHYPYAHTITAAGHVSMVTGCSPNKHGVVGNSWYDRETKTVVTSVSSEKYRQMPEPSEIPKGVKLGVTPEWRLQPSVADMLHRATKGRGKVVSLSIKDRAAALMAALLGGVVAWFSDYTGGFVTSTYYRDPLPEWADRFNDEKVAQSYFGKEWTRFRPDLDYTKLSGLDEMAGEAKSVGLGRTFPHPITGGKDKLSLDYFDAMEASPYGNELLVRFAKRAIDAEKLGQDEAPDLLMVSFSSNDLLGHLFGPDSHEVLDMTLRTDALIEDFLNHLDKNIGKGKYAVVLSSDHGICPLPEVALTRGHLAGRVSPAALRRVGENFLQSTFGQSKRPYLEEFVAPWFYLDRRTLAELKLEQSEVEQKLADWIVKEYGPKQIQAAYTGTQLQRGMPKDKLGASVWRSYHPDRCGDVFVITGPYFFITSYASGTTHGSPHAYDTHVPLYVFGPGIPGGASDEAVTPQAAAPILARFLGVDPPPGAEVGIPKYLRK